MVSCKKILIFFTIFVFFISFFTTFSQADTVATIDIDTVFQTQFNYVNVTTVNFLLSLWQNGLYHTEIKQFCDEVDSGYSYYCQNVKNEGSFGFITYQVPSHPAYSNQSFNLWGSDATLTTSAVQVKVLHYYVYYPDSRTFSVFTAGSSEYLYIPRANLNQYPKETYEFVQYVSHNAPNLTKIYEAIINTTTGLKSQLDGLRVTVDFSDLDINFQQIITTINKTSKDTQNKLDELKQSINDTNNFLKDTNTDDSDYGFSSDNGTNDVTSDGLNSIFTTFYNCFANADDKDIVFPLPFVNKSITIPAKFLENTLKAHGFQFVVDLARTVWLFAISCFIIKDVSNYVDKLKTGEILSKSDTNIKTDIL